MLVKNLTPNTVINSGRELLTVKSIYYMEHNIYQLSFYDIQEISYLDGDTEVRVL